MCIAVRLCTVGLQEFATMPLLQGVANRSLEPEVMDDPQLDQARHYQALRGLARINLLSASAGILWKPVARLARRQSGQPLRVLDIATGGGDIPIQLWRRSQKAGIPLEITGVDISPQALEFARTAADKAGADVTFEHRDVLADGMPAGYDIITASLFLHHLTAAQAVQLMRDASQAARKMVLINDLKRSRTGLLLAHVASRLFTRSDVVKTDAVLSVKAAFTLQEARDLAEQAGLNDAEFTRQWPQRFLLEWSPT